MKRGKAIIVLFLLLFFSCSNAKKKYNKPVREPVASSTPDWAGFYPSNPKNLKELINDFLKKAKKYNIPEKKEFWGFIVPHAGYIYSGETASYAYKQLIGEQFDTVVLLGVSHRVLLKYASVYPEGYYKTPLGLIPVDEDITKKLLKSNLFSYKKESHEFEHSIEVQLPFLQVVLNKNFKIVPILIGGGEFESYFKIANTIYNTLKQYPEKRVLFIASSDLSHYPNYKIAKKIDMESINLIINFKIKKLFERESKVRESKIPNLVTYYCGLYPISVLLHLARLYGVEKGVLLNYSNSGDYSWVKERVVGYSAIGFIKKRSKKMEKGFNLTEEEKKFLLKIARETLEEYVKNRKVPNFDIPYENLKKKCGAFVTLNKNHQLRGCIGYILPVYPLYRAVIDNTINACSRDWRFNPVTPDELKDIEIEISVLSPPVPVKSYKEIEIGKHGIILKKGIHQAVFLPQVAPEQGWDLATTLSHLAMKAGLPPDAWKEGCKFEVFTAIVFSESDFK